VNDCVLAILELLKTY
jgi:histone deacetylase 1/2